LNLQARAQNATAARAIVSTPEGITWVVKKGVYPSVKEVSHVNLYLPALTHLTPLTYVLDALRTFMLAG
jgi:hypothetical protein